MRQHSEHPFGCCLFRRERSRESCSIHSIGHLDQFASVVIIAAPERVWDAWVGQAVQDLTDKRLLRQLVPVTPIGCPTNALWPVRSGSDSPGSKQVLSFALNDYLGLAAHHAVQQATARAAAQHGSGPRSSALLGGYTVLHAQLEQALARLKHTEDALLFSSGFAANLSVLSAFASGADCAVFSDALNHASIVDGARLAAKGGAELHVYRHKDVYHLDALLRKSTRRRKLVVTDTLFSMDGDFADLGALTALKRTHDFLLVVDDAHGTLVCGPRGEGVAAAQGVTTGVDICVGTLSKAFGAHGGFAALSTACKQLLLNRGRSYVFSTALPVPIVAAALAALHIAVDKEPWRRQHLAELTQRLCAGLAVHSSSPIVPLLVGGEADAMAISADLLQQGFHVPAIRPPTVPAGTCRLRIGLSAAHSTEDIDALTDAVKAAFSRRGIAVRTACPEQLQPSHTLRPVAAPLAKL